jgi:hypothetical protein
MTTTTQEPNPRRRWFQIGLRLALIVTLCWIGLRLQRSRANRDRMAAVAKTVDAAEDLSGAVKGRYEERRPQTWLEEMFDDPGDVDDPVRVLRVVQQQPGMLLAQWFPATPKVPLGPEEKKQKSHLHNKALINAAVERYYVNTGNWPSSDLKDLSPPTTYDYFPLGIPVSPVDGSVYTIDETTHRVL